VTLANIGPTELLLVLVVLGLTIVGFGLPIWAIVHAARAPDAAWDAVGQSRATWIALLAVGLFLSPIGLLLALVYIATVRPKVHRAALHA